MTDAGPRRDHAEVVERLLTPAQELIPLDVALVFHPHVDQERGVAAELVNLYGVVDHQIDRLLRIDPGGLTAEAGDGIPHGGEIHHAGDPRKILQKNTGGAKRDFRVDRLLHVPVGERFDAGRLDEGGILSAQQVLQKYLEGERQAIDIPV